MLPALIAGLLPLLDKIIPDPQAAASAKLEALRLAQAGDFKELDTVAAISAQQAQINALEAQQGPFRGGWRPFIGWTCGAALAYHFIARPVVPWLFLVNGYTVPALPPLNMNELMTITTGMLGLAGLRTFERQKGKA